MRSSRLLFLVGFACFTNRAFPQKSNWEQLFKEPPAQYRPMPFWHLNGQLSDTVIDRQMNDVKYASNFGGVTVLPVWGMRPGYLSNDYFNLYGRILVDAQKLGLQVIWYDDIGFPSGSAGGRFGAMYPADIRKVLNKKESVIGSNTPVEMQVPSGKLMSAVAMNIATKALMDIRPDVNNGVLKWVSPAGDWKVMLFTCDVVSSSLNAKEKVVDYLDAEAVAKYVNLNHEQFAQRFKNYYGPTTTRIFFDDVGFYTEGGTFGERSWTNGFNNKFKALYGIDPALYYPALWEDIGPQTEAARAALFNTRAELLAEGFPKVVADWCNKYGLMSMGHPPGNYEIQPVDMNGDIFKYYRHHQIPLMDMIFYHGHGREGYKLISSAASLYDKDIVGAEIYGAIGSGAGGPIGNEKLTTKMLYQCAMEVFARGINFLVPHGMWLNPAPYAVSIPPLISAYSKEIGPELPQYNAWAGRSCLLLQGGKTVADIAMLYPIAALEGWFKFDMKKGWGKNAPPGTDYLAISDMLTNQVHRDFTFIHPESLSGNKILVEGSELVLDNAVNKQRYKVLILPAGDIISLSALQKISEFYKNGGKIIATGALPDKSAEFGMDGEVVKLISNLFYPDGKVKTNAKHGQTIFINKPDADILAKTFTAMGIKADVSFKNNPQPLSGNGMLSYIHKVKEEKDIYFFANSTDENVNTTVQARGKIIPQLWNPYTGTISIINGISYYTDGTDTYTNIPLKLDAVQSLFIIGQ